MHTLRRRLGLLSLSAAMVLALAAPAYASSSTKSLPNGCTITAQNSYSSNHAVASTTKAGGTCYKIQVKFQYYDDSSGTYKWKDSGYQNSPSVSKDAYTSVQPTISHHNGQATSGGTLWGFGLYF